MIDLLERQVIYTVLVTGTPRFIITGLYRCKNMILSEHYARWSTYFLS